MREEPDLFDIFVCSECGAPLALTNPPRDPQCGACGHSFDCVGDVIDFVSEQPSGSERAYYDQYYRDREKQPVSLSRDLGALASSWTGPDAPWEMQRVWERIGDINGKTVLLVGNGESAAELHMLTGGPRALIYSDISPVGLAKLADECAELGSVFFAAIDALYLPLRDDSVDVVYGFAFVHHLPDLDRFLAEVARVLRPGGRAVFMDNGYSALWQHVKLFWLRPLMWLSHRREPRSPEDMRDTMAGGLREEDLAERIRRVGGEPRFERVAFLYFFWKRVSVSLFPEIFGVIPRHDLVSRWLKRIDSQLARFGFFQRNAIRLVWGLDKPPASAASTSQPRSDQVQPEAGSATRRRQENPGRGQAADLPTDVSRVA